MTISEQLHTFFDSLRNKTFTAQDKNKEITNLISSSLVEAATLWPQAIPSGWSITHDSDKPLLSCKNGQQQNLIDIVWKIELLFNRYLRRVMRG